MGVAFPCFLSCCSSSSSGMVSIIWRPFCNRSAICSAMLLLSSPDSLLLIETDSYNNNNNKQLLKICTLNNYTILILPSDWSVVVLIPSSLPLLIDAPDFILNGGGLEDTDSFLSSFCFEFFLFFLVFTDGVSAVSCIE